MPIVRQGRGERKPIGFRTGGAATICARSNTKPSTLIAAILQLAICRGSE